MKYLMKYQDGKGKERKVFPAPETVPPFSPKQIKSGAPWTEVLG